MKIKWKSKEIKHLLKEELVVEITWDSTNLKTQQPKANLFTLSRSIACLVPQTQKTLKQLCQVN